MKSKLLKIKDYHVDSLEENHFRCKVGFSILGVKIGLRTDLDININDLTKLLPMNAVFTKFDESEHLFSLIMNTKIKKRGFYWNNELISGASNIRNYDLDRLEHKVQDVLSLVLMPEKFIFHAGGVSYNGVGIIFPGRSFAGKSTLTKAFLEAGADYYSDDCAVVDKEGYLHPYTTPMKIRDEMQQQQIYYPESFGAKLGFKTVPVKIVLSVKYTKGETWKKSTLSKGAASFFLMDNLFFRQSIQKHPEETFSFLDNFTDETLMFEGVRGEASEVVSDILSIIDEMS